jgi:hypothetical protein
MTPEKALANALIEVIHNPKYFADVKVIVDEAVGN